jgi:hypothetical protein
MTHQVLAIIIQFIKDVWAIKILIVFLVAAMIQMVSVHHAINLGFSARMVIVFKIQTVHKGNIICMENVMMLLRIVINFSSLVGFALCAMMDIL